MKIAITGGAGYVGTVLSHKLLLNGHDVTVLDTFWFGDHLLNNKKITKIQGDIRSIDDLRAAFSGQDAVIHLACVSNDPSFDMNPGLGKEINYTCFKDLIKVVNECNVKRFIYASSSSVYGISDRPDVIEGSPKSPITDYSKYKLACESWLQSYGTGGAWTILRPATVCGYSPRQRFDLVVNVLTIQAIVNKRITLFGREQLRPNIHIDDMCEAYIAILNANEKDVDRQVFNVGFENKSLFHIAEQIREVIPCQIEDRPVVDRRSYHVNSNKISSIFKPTFGITEAIDDILGAFRKDLFKDPINNSIYYNIKRMKELGL